jgi:hypothetical protein
VTADAKTAGRQNLHLGGKKVALNAAKVFEAAGGDVTAIPKISTLTRIVNHDRSKDRPKHPTSLDFTPAVQVPVCFIVMSSRTTADYKAVFRRLLILIAKAKVQEVVADFQRAIISAIKSVLPQVKFFGCAFHFCQALFRRFKRLGLSLSYKNDEKFRDLCRKFMCLNLLPKGKILKVFDSLKTNPLK